MTTRGIDVRQSTGRIVFRASLKDDAGDMLATGTTELRVLRVEDDGTLDVYDWTTNDFVATGAGTPDDETTMTHRQRRDSTGADVDTGLWTVVLSTLTNWVAGQVYIAQVYNSGASPPYQEREFQFGDVEGGQLGVTTEGNKLTVESDGMAHADVKEVAGNSTVPTNLVIVYATDFATNYNTTLDQWNVNVESWDTTAVMRDSLTGANLPLVAAIGVGEFQSGDTLAIQWYGRHFNWTTWIDFLSAGAQTANNFGVDCFVATQFHNDVGEQFAIATEAAILNEGDATALLAAIAAKVEEFVINEGDATATLVAIATAVISALGTGSGLTSLATAAAQVTAQGVLDKLNDTLEDQGGGTFGFTVAALQEAPTGGGSAPTVDEIADELDSRHGTGPWGVAALGSHYKTVERSSDDTAEITFQWPVTGATITAEHRINNAGSWTATTGTVAFERSDGDVHLYTLSYSADDRPNDEGTVAYKLDDGTYTRYLYVRIVGAAVSSVGGSGAIETNITVQVGGLPVDGVEVWITTDEVGSNVVAGTLVSDALGLCTFMLDAGDYYVWRQKAGYNLDNPQAITVS